MVATTSGIDFSPNGKNLDITLYQGKTLSWSIIWGGDNPINVTGFTARMQLRTTLEAASVIAELTTENGCITMGGADGLVHIHMTAAQTAALKAGKGYWDLELVDTTDTDIDPLGHVNQIQSGKYTIVREITR